MLVSILLPVYNAAPYLEECMDSILCQTHKSLEVLAVDDFSDDGSLDMLLKYAKQDDRVKVFSNKDKGILPALRLAYQHSKGRYITRMDADDLMVKHKLACMLANVERSPNSVVVGKVKYFATGKELASGYLKYADWLNEMVDEDSHFDHIYQECVVPSPCWMMSTELLRAIGGFDFEQYPEDYDLAFRLYEQQVKILGVDEVLHLWRDHDSRASRNDKHYSDQGFLQLKLHYFLKIDRHHAKPLILWGAGRTGKAVAKCFLEKEVQFRWFTDNDQKVGHDVYGVILEHAETLYSCKDAQVITAIKTPDFLSASRVLVQVLRQANVDVYHFF